MLRQGSCYGDTSRVEEVGTSWLRLGDATAPGSRAGFSPTLETVHLGRTSAHLGTLKPLTAMENCQCGWKNNMHVCLRANQTCFSNHSLKTTCVPRQL